MTYLLDHGADKTMFNRVPREVVLQSSRQSVFARPHAVPCWMVTCTNVFYVACLRCACTRRVAAPWTTPSCFVGAVAWSCLVVRWSPFGGSLFRPALCTIAELIATFLRSTWGCGGGGKGEGAGSSAPRTVRDIAVPVLNRWQLFVFATVHPCRASRCGAEAVLRGSNAHQYVASMEVPV